MSYELPAPGRETLETWSNAFTLAHIEKLEEEYKEGTPEEQEKIKQRMNKIFDATINYFKSMQEESQKEENQTQDPFDFVCGIAGRFFTPLLQEAAAEAGLPDTAQQNFQNFVEASYTKTTPQVMRNAAQIYTPENIEQIDAYTPLRDIWAVMSPCMHGPMKELLVHTDFSVRRKETEEKEKEKEVEPTPEEILDETLDDIFKPIPEEEFDKMWEKMDAEVMTEWGMSIASARGIHHPDTLEGRYQRMQLLPQLTDGSEKTRELVAPSHPLEEMADQAMAIMGITQDKMDEADLALVREGIAQKYENQMGMKCAVSGCQNLTEFEARKEKLAELKKEASRRTDPVILLQRDYEGIAVFLEDPQDQLEFAWLFELFMEDKEAYQCFKTARNRAEINSFLMLYPALQRAMHSMQEGSVQELLDPSSISLCIAQAMREVKEHLNQEYLQIDGEYSQKGHYYACKWLEKCGPSLLRLELAKLNPYYKLAKEMKDLGFIEKMPKKQNIVLTEFDLKFAQASRIFGANPTDNLPELDLMNQMGSKSDEEMIALLMEHESQQHRQFIEAFGMVVMPDLIDDERL